MLDPRRHALVELVNSHDSALEFEPSHRVLFGLDRFLDVIEQLQYFPMATGNRRRRGIGRADAGGSAGCWLSWQPSSASA